MASAKETLNAKIESFFDELDQMVANSDRLDNYIKTTKSLASNYESEDPATASVLYFLPSIACLCYCIRNKCTLYLDKGEELLLNAKRIIPEDKEYALYQIVFNTLNAKASDPLQAYDQMKALYKACPSFRLLENNIFTPEWSEECFNDVFSFKFIPVVEGLLYLKRYDLTKEACTLLASFPDIEAKMKAYTYLSRVLYEEKNYDESLRNAKLGVELLGSNVEYNYHNNIHLLWGECWTRVGECARLKKDYDFAMSIFEKGASLGIVPCISFLGSMYENGESEDKDIEKATELYNQAKAISDEREKKRLEEEDRIRKELEARQKREEEAKREKVEQEALVRLKKQNKSKKIWYSIGITACTAIIAFCLANISKDTILDHVRKYNVKGYAVLNLLEGDSPMVVVMNKNGIYLDNMRTVSKLLNVGSFNYANGYSLIGSTKGLRLKFIDRYDSLKVNTYKDFYLSPLVWGRSYLITNTKQYSSIKNAYILYSINGKNTLVKVDAAELQYDGTYKMKLTGDLSVTEKKYFVSLFGQEGFSTIQKRGYGYFETECEISNKSPTISFDSHTFFPIIKRTFASNTIGKKNQLTQLSQDYETLLRGGLTDPLISDIFHVNGTLKSHPSSNGKYTFVIKEDGDDKHEKMGLFLVDNATKNYKCIRHAIDIRFLSSSIYLKVHDTFLLFFNTSKDEYMSYDVN